MTTCIVSQQQLDRALNTGEAAQTATGYSWHGFNVEVSEDAEATCAAKQT